MKDVTAREMLARLTRIESTMNTLPARLHDIRQRYDVAAGMYRTLKTMLAHLPPSPARDTLVLYADMVLRNIYALADALSTLAALELAASDYAVLMALLRGMVDDEAHDVELVQITALADKEKSA